MFASTDAPVAVFHLGGQMFAGDSTHYPQGWYVLDGQTARPLRFADTAETRCRVDLSD